MSIIKKIEQKDPLKVSDDDHPERPDISKEEFIECINEMKEKFGTEETPLNKNKFSKGVIDALNSQ